MRRRGGKTLPLGSSNKREKESRPKNHPTKNTFMLEDWQARRKGKELRELIIPSNKIGGHGG